VAVAALASACAAAARTEWRGRPGDANLPTTGPVFVMEPLVNAVGPPGNVGRDLPAVSRDLLGRILAVVRERFPASEPVARGPYALPALAGYPRNVDGDVVTREELEAARRAYERGATHLLVPIIADWKEARTDDPVGAFVGARSMVRLTLRLMALRPPSVVGDVVFANRARVTLNRPARGLLNERFRRALLQLLSGPARGRP
jgi:hypothetical protein